MKFLIALSASLFMSQPAFSTLISCENQIKIDVTNWIDDGLRVNSVTESFKFSEHTVYDVSVGLDLEEGMIGIPYVAQYKVLVKDLGLGACAVVDTVLELEAH